MAYTTAPIVVGVDGSAASQGALRWAADEAFRHARPLRIVHALGLPGPFGWPQDGQTIVHDAAALAYGWHVTIDVETAVSVGSAAPVLCEESKRAALMVVGSRGYGGFQGLLIGSVGSHLSTHGSCPVLVVHGAERWAGPEVPLPHERPVVVGVDGSPGSTRALRLAFDEAASRQAGLLIIRAIRPTEDQTAVTAALDADVAPWEAKFPDVKVEQLVRPGPAAGVLTDAAEEALMVVVGTRGAGGFAGLRLGSVSQQVLHHAPCPVLVARGPDEPGGPS
jgi:nucleotide-binding universal stress UspA family protein